MPRVFRFSCERYRNDADADWKGEQTFVALKKAGVNVEFIRYPGGSHLMLRGGPTAHKVDYYTRVLGWFRRYLLEA